MKKVYRTCLMFSLSLWCKANEMCVNNQKSNVVHFRPPSVDRTHVNFHCGDGAISVVNKYTYLGILLDEFLDYNVTAKESRKVPAEPSVS